MRTGAGVIPLALTTGRVLLGERASPCSDPDTWAGFGGLVEREDITVVGTALRELFEETGYAGPIRLVDHAVAVRNGTSAHMFVGLVPEEFEPELNWEHHTALWLDPMTLNPAAMHWTVKEFRALTAPRWGRRQRGA